MTTIPSADVKLMVAKGGFTSMVDRGGCDGGYMAWEQERQRWTDWATLYELGVTSNDAQGIIYEPALEAAMLNWQIIPQDIDEQEALSSSAGDWALVTPPGNPRTSRWHQFNCTSDMAWAKVIRQQHPRNRPFCVSVYREATPSRQGVVNEDLLPYYVTLIRFGGRFELRLPKWRSAELWRLSAGQWKPVLSMQWRHVEMYNDSHSAKELFITILPLDGMLLIKNSYTDEAMVYSEAKPISLEAGPIIAAGNGGAAYFGLHDVRFNTAANNYLVSRDGLRTYRSYFDLPGRRLIGSQGPACTAELLLYDESGRPWTPERTMNMGENLPGPVRKRGWFALRYAKVLHLQTTDPYQTPLVRFAGVTHPPRPAKLTPNWQDISRDVISLSGGWRTDLERRTITQEYEISLDNTDGQHADWTDDRLVSLEIGYEQLAGDELSPGRVRRALAYAYPKAKASDNIGKASLEVQTLDRVQTLYEMECGYRAPQDGMRVVEAIAEALEWAGTYCRMLNWDGRYELGEMYDSGRRIPTSRYAAQQQLAALHATASAGDGESRAVAQPDPAQRIGEWIGYLMQYDFMTLLQFNPGTGRFDYLYIGGQGGDTRHLYEDGALSHLDSIRESFTWRGQIEQVEARVTVVGMDGVLRRPIIMTAADEDVIAGAASGRHVGFDRTARIRDDSLNSLALVNSRTRWEFERRRYLRQTASFAAHGQPDLWPLDKIIPHETRTGGGGQTYPVMAVTDSVDEERRYTAQIDAVRLPVEELYI